MLTTGGSVRILDFGLARLVTSELTRSNIVVGTMDYMAPEQVRAEPIDHRADIFSVGVSSTSCWRTQGVRGRLVRRHDYKVLQERPAPLPAVGHDVAPVISAIVDRAIEKDREHRYQNMGDMLRDLEEARAALPPASQIRCPAASAQPIGGALDIETTLIRRT